MLGRGDSFVARAVLSLGPTRAIAKHTGFRCFFVGWLMMLGRGDSFVARAVLSLGGSHCQRVGRGLGGLYDLRGLIKGRN